MTEPNEPARLEIALLRSARAVRRAFDSSLSDIGLSFSEGSLMSFVRQAGSSTQRELADRLHIGRASAGTFVEGLERKGLLSREVDAQDRRAWQVTLTAQGELATDEFERIDGAVRARLRAGLSRDERRLLFELLSRLESNAVGVHAGRSG